MAAERMPFSKGSASLIVVIDAASPAAARGVSTPIMSARAVLHTSSQLAGSLPASALRSSGDMSDGRSAPGATEVARAAVLLASEGFKGTSMATTWPAEFVATTEVILLSELRIAADAMPPVLVRVYIRSAFGLAGDLLVKPVLVPMNDNVPFCCSPRAVGSPLCENPCATR